MTAVLASLDERTVEMVARVVAAAVAGTSIGMERESHGRAAGLRTMMVVCVAAAVAMLLSEQLRHGVRAAGTVTGWSPDPARLAAGILSGMGFLGAGAIVREGNMVRGVTTAATLWYVTIIGLTLGAGEWLLAGLAWVLALLALLVLPNLERLILNDWYGVITVTMDADKPCDDHIRQCLLALRLGVKRVGLRHDTRTGERTIRCELKYKRSNLFQITERAVESVRQLPGVRSVEWS